MNALLQEHLIGSVPLQALLSESQIADETYLVGGVVRDCLLPVPACNDVDLTTTTSLNAVHSVLRKVQGIEEIKLHEKFGTMSVISESGLLGRIDIVRARKEHYPQPGSLPVVEPAGLEEDLQRRDFTLNALALPLKHMSSTEWPNFVIDSTGGRQDILDKLIRILHPKSFLDDPTRIYRCIKYAVRLGFNIEEKTESFLKQAIQNDALRTISLERNLHELSLACKELLSEKILASVSSEGIFSALQVPQLAELTNEIVRHREYSYLAMQLFWLYYSPPGAREMITPKLQLQKRILLRVSQVPSAASMADLVDTIIAEKRVARQNHS